MKLSYIIPIYNCGQYLQGCISSIEKTGFQDYEIIIVDDGSTDGSAQICENIAKNNGKIRCIHQINQGVSAARNSGFRNALGEYVLFIDADDNLDILELSSALSTLVAQPSIDMMLYGISFDYYFHKKIYRREVLPTPKSGLLQREEWLPMWKQLFYANSLSPIWNKIIRRQLLLEHKIYFDEQMIVYEDLVYSLKVLNVAKHIFFYPGIVYRYRQSEDEGNASRRLKKINQISKVVDGVNLSLHSLVGSFATQEEQNGILLDIYIALLRAKIAVSSRTEIKSCCEEFKIWYSNHMIDSILSSYTKLLLSGNVVKILINSYKTNIRHKVAVRVKSLSIYKIWRNEQWI